MPRYDSLHSGEFSVAQVSCSDKVVPEVFELTLKKNPSVIFRWAIFMQRRKPVTEGKETSAPDRAKKGLEEAA